MKEKVIIPNRGVVALDIIDSLKSIGYETLLLHSPEDANTLPVKLADRSFKFYSSRLEDSYKDMESIIDKALKLDARYIHPGYGFLAEDPDFAKMCDESGLTLIGPGANVLRIVRNKAELRKIADKLGIRVLPYLEVTRQNTAASSLEDYQYPLVIKPLQGYGGKGIRLVEFESDAKERIEKMLKNDSGREGLILEDYYPFAHHIEIPFIRDTHGNILFAPEIESSIQRRFQKIFQESPSVNISESLRKSLYTDAQKLIEELRYVGLGYVEFIIDKETAYFSEINPSIQINTIIPEIHMAANFIKKHFAINNGEQLYNVEGVKVIKPRYHVLLVSLMSENPFDNFQPSSGTVTEFFNYSTIRNIFKTYLYAGARLSPLYDPYIGKILTFSGRRDHSINDMRNFLNNIIIKGVKTNLPFMKHLLQNPSLVKGETIIDFLNLKFDFAKRNKSAEDIGVATALLSAAFHIENKSKDYKSQLAGMKQPGFLTRLFNRM